MRWLFLHSPPASGVENMAIDEALMRRATHTGDAVFRIYSWDRPTLSLGRNQRARGGYDLSAARERDIRIVRRPTGGRAILHHREITYSATLPCTTPAEAADAYNLINGVLVAGLRHLGVPAALATGTVAMPPGFRPCFDMPAEREIAIGERKLVGSAQWRSGGALLQHGSILVRDDQNLIGELLTARMEGATRAAATLHDALGRDPSVSDVARPILQALAESTESLVARVTLDARFESDVAELCSIYSDDAWTWRR